VACAQGGDGRRQGHLWTAAHHHIPVVFLIANNVKYKILKVSGAVMQLPNMTHERCLGMDLLEPEVDFLGLARSFGVEAHRVTGLDELRERLHASLDRNEPILLDAPLER
jgi:benzoylformate decarboxylase